MYGYNDSAAAAQKAMMLSALSAKVTLADGSEEVLDAARILSGEVAGVSLAMADGSELALNVPGSFGTLVNIPWVKLIVSFLIYFILGYLLYASMFAAVGSAVENEGDSQQLQMPLTIPLMIAYFIILMAFQNPDSGVVVWGSMIPFTSPIVMLARIPYGVPMWQLVVSIVLLLVTFFGCAWLSAKIYKVGILMFGKKSTFKDLWKWLRMK